MKKMKTENGAVSDVIGTIILLGITIALFSVLSGIILSYPFTPSPPTVNLISAIDEDEIIIEHNGGENIGLDTKIVIMLNSSKEEFKAGDHLDQNAKENGFWNLGEKVIFNVTTDSVVPYSDYENRTIKVTVLDKTSQSILMMGVIQEGFK